MNMNILLNIHMCAARKHIAILLRDNIAATKDEMNTTTVVPGTVKIG